MAAGNSRVEQMTGSYLHPHNEIRSTFQQVKENMNSLHKRIEEIEDLQRQQHERIRAALKDKENETEAVKQRIIEMDGQLQRTRNSSINKETLRKLHKRLKQIDEYQKQQHQHLRSALDQERENLTLAKESFKQIENIQQQQHALIRSALEEEEEFLRSSHINDSTFFQTIFQTLRGLINCITNYWNETRYQNNSVIDCQDQHHVIRSALEQEKENLKSLKQRLGNRGEEYRYWCAEL
ncbi:hypothetical protein CRENBAI_024512 [Crenichthys baileyi]|uniref:Uncharacterized protein n=1 Tax=Crenichthys baileyi TaxID=28760 RepID=A0AAV9RT76_9TELE